MLKIPATTQKHSKSSSQQAASKSFKFQKEMIILSRYQYKPPTGDDDDDDGKLGSSFRPHKRLSCYLVFPASRGIPFPADNVLLSK